jgi:hypothetical protein
MTRDAKILFVVEAVAIAAFLLTAGSIASFLNRMALALFLASLFHCQTVPYEWLKFRLRDAAVVVFCVGAGIDAGDFLYFFGAAAILLIVINTIRYHDGVSPSLRASAEEGRKLNEAYWKRVEESVRKIPDLADPYPPATDDN